MKRNNLGKFVQELKDPVLLKGLVERYDKNWAKAEAKKRKLSTFGFIRYLINQFRKGK